MKKIVMGMMAAAMLMACGGNKEAKSGDCCDSASTTSTTEAAPAMGKSVEKYIKLIEAALPVAEKIKAGDMDAMSDFMKRAEELGNLASSQEFLDEMQKLTPEQTKKLEEIVQKWTAAMQ